MTVSISRRSILQAASLLPALSLLSWPALGAPTQAFTHGVASGDPGRRGVMLWTRYVAASGGETSLRVEVAEDERFTRIVSRGTARAGPATDYCAHARPDDLKPGRWYYYRFTASGGVTSPVGRTRTLPDGPLDRFRIGVVSCANATSGWFNAYAHAAARDDLDLIVHTGDYIYESPVDRSDALAALAAARDVQPRGEAVTLADYRLRYASYRADPALQELHRRYPMIAIWDDHEVANNSWRGGARNHGPEEGPWTARVAAGMRAHREWLPMGRADYDRYRIGDLATLFRLETRLLARTEQLDIGVALRGATDPARAAAAFRDGPLADPARTMMGGAQERWLADGLEESTAAGMPWQILAQQVIMAPTRLPSVTPAWFPPGTTLAPRDQAELAAAVGLAKLGLPMGLDRWDGYPAARARLLAASDRARADLVVLSGDSHNAWAYDLEHEGKPVGVELAGHSVSSLGLEKRFGGDESVIARDFMRTNPGLKWCDTSRRGYMTVDITPDRVESEWLFLPAREERSTTLLGRHRMTVPRRAKQLVAA
ncbi:alkaline phosphatase D family protein [uncultured Sphingomonas sp.]|uniref:alkaline phosphatase D family protein n=1 Tax=uncultured Sphingomonas sp. TaxID=158754 RepID=UPI0035CC7143